MCSKKRWGWKKPKKAETVVPVISAPPPPVADPDPAPEAPHSDHVRHIEVRKTVPVVDHKAQWWWRVRGANNEVLYSSETFTRKFDAVRSARREHEGRTAFLYILEFPDENGAIVKETL